jgi:hypothetical protein
MHRVLDDQEAWLAVADDGTVLGLMVLDGDRVGQLSDFPQSRLHKGDGRDCGELESGEADVQDEVSEPQVEYSASGSVHNERQQDDGQDDDDHPEEEHDDAGNGIPGYGSRSSHRPQLPIGAAFIRRRILLGWIKRS